MWMFEQHSTTTTTITTTTKQAKKKNSWKTSMEIFACILDSFRAHMAHVQVDLIRNDRLTICSCDEDVRWVCTLCPVDKQTTESDRGERNQNEWPLDGRLHQHLFTWQQQKKSQMRHRTLESLPYIAKQSGDRSVHLHSLHTHTEIKMENNQCDGIFSFCFCLSSSSSVFRHFAGFRNHP